MPYVSHSRTKLLGEKLACKRLIPSSVMLLGTSTYLGPDSAKGRDSSREALGLVFALHVCQLSSIVYGVILYAHEIA